MIFPDVFIDELKRRIPISKLVSSRIKLQRRGPNLLGLCPFHNEKTPSFTVSDFKGTYYCFGCHAHGDIIQFVSEIDGISFTDTVEYLANYAGLELPKLKQEDKKKIELHNNIINVLNSANEWYFKQLKLSINHHALEYLINRSITQNEIEKFYIGYAPKKGLLNYLRTNGFSYEVMVNAGLAIKTENKEYIERFRERVIFPIFNQKNQVVGFGGRALNKESMPKYLNSPETEVFKKNRLLYALNHSYKSIHQKRRLIVVEGYIDAIFMHKEGFTETVAALGTAFNQIHLENLWHLADEPILCFDGDSAGKKAMLKAAKVALPLLKPGISLRFCFLPDGNDPDEIIKLYGSKKMEALIENSVSLSDFIWQAELENAKFTSPENRALFEHDIYSIIDEIKDPIVKAHYRKFIKDKLWNEFNQQTKFKFDGNTKRNVQIKQIKYSKPNSIKSLLLKERLEYSLFAQLVCYPFLIKNGEIMELFSELVIENDELEKMRECILTYDDQRDNSLNDLLNEKKLGNLINFLCGPESSFIDAISTIDNDTARLIWLLTHKKYFLELLKNEFKHILKKFPDDAMAIEKANELKKAIEELDKEITYKERIINDYES